MGGPGLDFIENQGCFTPQRAMARWLKMCKKHVFNLIHYMVEEDP